MEKKAILAKSDTIWIPNSKQKKLAQLLADPTDERTNHDKAQEVGVSLRTFYRYIKDLRFVEYVNGLVPQEADKEIAPIWWKLRLAWLKRTIDRPEILKRYPSIGLFFWHLFLAIIGFKKYRYGNF